MSRILILVADSLGLGATPDAHQFNDVGADTLGHLAQAFAQAKNRPLNIPNLADLGMVHAYQGANQKPLHCQQTHRQLPHPPIASYGWAKELSTGKDTPSGHWELMGVPVQFEWGYFANTANCFPPQLLEELFKQGGISGSLCNSHGSGTIVIQQYGQEHINTGKPIIYTSGDSVFQIAAHEEHFGLQRLIDLCEVARELVDPYNIGRVIARPFIGTNPSDFVRTGNRRDYSVLPPSPTLLEKHTDAGGIVISIGKIADIFAHQGISEKYKATGLAQLLDVTEQQLDTAVDNSIIFTNLVDFDSHYGHRRDPIGYGEALEYFDARLGTILNKLAEDDILIITADHGCDPTWPGSDHTREYIPVLFYGKQLTPTNLGTRESFADIGQTLAKILNLTPTEYGTSFYNEIKG